MGFAINGISNNMSIFPSWKKSPKAEIPIQTVSSELDVPVKAEQGGTARRSHQIRNSMIAVLDFRNENRNEGRSWIRATQGQALQQVASQYEEMLSPITYNYEKKEISGMNINLNNTNHQVNMGVGKNGVLKFGLNDSEKKSFGEIQEAMLAKAANEEEESTVMRFMQIPDELLIRGQVRMAKSNLFSHKMELAQSGDMEAKNDIKALFERFGLARFLVQNMDDNNNFVTNLVSMNQREREAFLRLEEYVLGGNRI